MKIALLTILCVFSPFTAVWTMKALELSYFHALLVGSIPIFTSLLIWSLL